MGPDAHIEEQAFRFDSTGRAWSADVAWFQRGAFTGNKPFDVDFLPVFMLRMDRKSMTPDRKRSGIFIAFTRCPRERAAAIAPRTSRPHHR
jgi:hypothetical protein